MTFAIGGIGFYMPRWLQEVRHLDPKEAIPKASAAARRALELDGELAESHFAMGYVQLNAWNWPEAEAEIKRAIVLNPQSPVAHETYGLYFLAVGRFEDGVREMLQAQELDPISTPINIDLGFALIASRQLEKAILQAEHAIKLDPGNSVAREQVGLAYLLKGDFDRALSTFQGIESRGIFNHIQCNIARVYALTGKRGEARKILRSLEEGAAQRPDKIWEAGQVYAALGESDQAFKCLDQAYENHSVNFMYLQPDLAWDNIRLDARYPALLNKVGLRK